MIELMLVKQDVKLLSTVISRVLHQQIKVTLSFIVTKSNHKPCSLLFEKTIRDRPKSAPYLRLENSKRISKCQSHSSQKSNQSQSITMKTQPISPDRLRAEKQRTYLKKKNWKRRKCQKLKGEPLLKQKKIEKKSHSAEKKRG